MSSVAASITRSPFHNLLSMGSIRTGVLGINASGFGFLFPRLSPSSSFSITLPESIGEWILSAVPKKKPSYRRTRQKLYASGDKKIKPLENLVRCPACGAVKRSHFMCMNCFMEIKQFLKSLKPKSETIEPQIDEIDQKIIYPGKRPTDYERKLAKRDWIPQREELLMFNAKQVKHKSVKK